MGSEGEDKEDAPEQRGFQDGVDLRLGAIEHTNVRGRERERERDNQKSTKQFLISNDKNRKVCMHENA